MKSKLILYTDTFLWVKNNKGLLYNAKFFTTKDFIVTSSIKDMCEQLLDYDNLYCITIDKSKLDSSSQDFVQQITDNRFGEIFEENASIISIPPLLNIQSDISKLSEDSSLDIGENVLTYLHTLTIYTGGECSDNQYYKQIIYPVSTANDRRLSSKQIYDFLKTNASPYLHTINIVVSDIENYDIESILELLANFKKSIIFNFMYPDTENALTIAHKIISDGYRISIICELPSSIDEFINMAESFDNLGGNIGLFNYSFLVKNLDEYQFWTDLVERHKINNYQITPVYDNNNNFFRDNIFLTKSDIEECKLSRREVFAHQSVNTLMFGSLTIMPNGQIFSNVNSESIGSIKDSIYDIITKELSETNFAWRKIRDSKKCENCVYQWLCPSPSHYEQVMNIESICINI